MAARNKQGLVAGAVAVLDEADLTDEDFFNCGILVAVSNFRFSLALDQV